MNIEKVNLIKEKSEVLADKHEDVFTDEYIPDEIKFRDEEIETIIKNILGKLNVFLIGNVGTGKTLIIKWILKNLKKLTNSSNNILYIYQSCRGRTFNSIWYEICCSIGISISKRQSIATYDSVIYDYISKNNIKKIIIALDEADEISSRYTDPELLYFFANSGYYTMIMVGNTPEWISNIGIRTKTRLSGRVITLEKYNEYEINEILRQRTKLSSDKPPIHFEEIEIISNAIINDKITLREAIKVISYIYNYKKFENKESEILDSNTIEKFFRQVRDDSLITYFKVQSPVLKMVIVAATIILSKKKEKIFKIADIKNIFNANVPSNIGKKSLSSIRGYLKELETYGFFKEEKRGREKSSYNLVYSPKFDVDEFELFFKTERIIK